MLACSWVLGAEKRLDSSTARIWCPDGWPVSMSWRMSRSIGQWCVVGQPCGGTTAECLRLRRRALSLGVGLRIGSWGTAALLRAIASHYGQARLETGSAHLNCRVRSHRDGQPRMGHMHAGRVSLRSQHSRMMRSHPLQSAGAPCIRVCCGSDTTACWVVQGSDSFRELLPRKALSL